MENLIYSADTIKKLEDIREDSDTFFTVLDAMDSAIAAVKSMPAVDAVPVIRCKDCGHCFELSLADPMTPYRGGGSGFYCAAWDMDFYKPHCDPETYYCADAKPREAQQPTTQE